MTGIEVKELCKELGIMQKELAEELGLNPIAFNRAISEDKISKQTSNAIRLFKEKNELKRKIEVLEETIKHLSNK